MSNLPVLFQNVLAGLCTEVGRKAFLWAAETKDASRFKYPAEAYAQEVDRICASKWVELIDQHGKRIAESCTGGHWDRETLTDLLQFILKRHANHKFGGNVQMWWE